MSKAISEAALKAIPLALLLTCFAVSPVGAGGTINIVGGVISATGGAGAAGIGGAAGENGGTITITNSGNTVTELIAIAGPGPGAPPAAIGKGAGVTSASVTVNGNYDYWTSATTTPPGSLTGSGTFSTTDINALAYVRLALVGLFSNPPTGLPDMTAAAAAMFALFAMSAALWAYSFARRRDESCGYE